MPRFLGDDFRAGSNPFKGTSYDLCSSFGSAFDGDGGGISDGAERFAMNIK